MKTNYVLVDFENVQPSNMNSLQNGLFKIKVFVGLNQKIPVDVAKAVQAFGSDAEYIQIGGTGKNALDFHIAYYVGRLASESTDAHFYIVSKDSGFDPLILHLKRQKIICQRISSIADIQPNKQEPGKKSTAVSTKKSLDGKSIAENVTAVIVRLSKGPKPRTEKTLRSFIKSTFAGRPGGEQADAIIEELQKRTTITISEGQIHYGLLS